MSFSPASSAFISHLHFSCESGCQLRNNFRLRLGRQEFKSFEQPINHGDMQLPVAYPKLNEIKSLKEILGRPVAVEVENVFFG